MISVSDALAAITGLFTPLPTEWVDLRQAAGRILSRDVAARRDQPPFAASAMDGYAVRTAEVAAGARFAVIGESAAGNGFPGRVEPGQTVRIFTGAPVPEGADRVIIQEDVAVSGGQITLNPDFDRETYVRPAGFDFKAGETMQAPRRLSPSDVALLASMTPIDEEFPEFDDPPPAPEKIF